MPACPRCGVENPSDSQHCRECGAELPPIRSIAGAASNPPRTGDPAGYSGPTTTANAAQPATPAQMQSSPGRSRTWLIAGCAGMTGCMIVTAICGVLALLYYFGDSPSVPEGDSTTRRVVTPTETPIPPIKIGTETLPVRQLLIMEDFSSASRGWEEERVEGLYKYVSNGEYHIEIRNNNIPESSTIKFEGAIPDSDFALLVSARTDPTTTKSQYGLLYHDKTANQWYQFSISDNGYFQISYFGPNAQGAPSWQTAVPWQATNAIRPPGTFNQLAMVRRGTAITFYLNGRQLTSLENSSRFPPSTVGVYAATADEPIVMSFDNFYLVALK